MTLKRRVEKLEKVTRKSEVPLYYFLEPGAEIPEEYKEVVKVYEVVSPEDWTQSEVNK
jgi:hypothetical protein